MFNKDEEMKFICSIELQTEPEGSNISNNYRKCDFWHIDPANTAHLLSLGSTIRALEPEFPNRTEYMFYESGWAGFLPKVTKKLIIEKMQEFNANACVNVANAFAYVHIMQDGVYKLFGYDLAPPCP